MVLDQILFMGTVALSSKGHEYIIRVRFSHTLTRSRSPSLAAIHKFFGAVGIAIFTRCLLTPTMCNVKGKKKGVAKTAKKEFSEFRDRHSCRHGHITDPVCLLSLSLQTSLPSKALRERTVASRLTNANCRSSFHSLHHTVKNSAAATNRSPTHSLE